MGNSCLLTTDKGGQVAVTVTGPRGRWHPAAVPGPQGLQESHAGSPPSSPPTVHIWIQLGNSGVLGRPALPPPRALRLRTPVLTAACGGRVWKAESAAHARPSQLPTGLVLSPPLPGPQEEPRPCSAPGSCLQAPRRTLHFFTPRPVTSRAGVGRGLLSCCAPGGQAVTVESSYNS